jgi:hypothetical protein
MRLLVVVAICVSSLLLGCTRDGARERIDLARWPAPPAAQLPAGDAPDAAASLPAPSSLAGTLHPLGPTKETRLLPADLLKEGEDFATGLPSQRTAVISGGARFNPDYPPGAEFAGLSFAMYPFDIAGYTGAAELHYGWITPPEPADAYIGLAHWTADTWDW